MSSFKETIVISVGGSLLIPDQIDVLFIKHLRKIVSFFVDDGYQIALVVGGGKTSRRYCKTASEFEHISSNDLDWIGIKTIHLNAELIRRVFKDLGVHPKVILQEDEVVLVNEAVAIVGAWQPGHSSDYNAVTMAQSFGAKRVINFSNISHVYDKDPNAFDDAKVIESLSWNEYLDIIPEQWTPNMSSPFDPIASKKAQEANMTVVILGSSVENLNNYLKGDDFIGSVIK